jgi:hypothetical protein
LLAIISEVLDLLFLLLGKKKRENFMRRNSTLSFRLMIYLCFCFDEIARLLERRTERNRRVLRDFFTEVMNTEYEQ